MLKDMIKDRPSANAGSEAANANGNTRGQAGGQTPKPRRTSLPSAPPKALPVQRRRRFSSEPVVVRHGIAVLEESVELRVPDIFTDESCTTPGFGQLLVGH